jgi:hypothetical protein
VGKNKGAPARRPVKAKGTIPAPRTGYRAARKPWYKHRQFQVVGGLIVLVLLGFAVYQFTSWRDRVEARDKEKKAVKAFNDKVQAIQGDITDPLTDMSTKPEQFKNGQIKADEYTTAAQGWLAKFQDMATELRSQNPPAGLQDVRARMVESSVIFIDAIRTYQLAAQTGEPSVRDQAVLLASRAREHAMTIYGNALWGLNNEKKRVGLPTSEFGDAPQLPQEDVQPAPAASPTP